jgi:hypothetical protein
MSSRVVDKNGFIYIPNNNIAKEDVYPYLASELQLTDRTPNSIVYVYRPAEELIKAIDSLKLMPFINDHEYLGLFGTPTEKKGVLGTTGEQVSFDSPYLKSNIKIHASIAEDLLQKGKVELSAGYDCIYKPEIGSFNGKPYEFTQREIIYNHVALVDEGRGGAEISVADRKSIFTVDFNSIKEVQMSLEEILAAIGAMSEEDKATLSAKLNPVSDEEKTEDNEIEDKVEELVVAVETAIEEGSDVAVVEAVIAEAEMALEEVKEEVKAMDSLTRRLKLAKKSLVVKSLDSSTLIKEIAQRDNLAKKLITHIGAFDYSVMTAQEVAEIGIKKMDIKCAKGSEMVALDAVLQVKISDSQKVTMDSKPSVNNLWEQK